MSNTLYSISDFLQVRQFVFDAQLFYDTAQQHWREAGQFYEEAHAAKEAGHPYDNLWIAVQKVPLIEGAIHSGGENAEIGRRLLAHAEAVAATIAATGADSVQMPNGAGGTLMPEVLQVDMRVAKWGVALYRLSVRFYQQAKVIYLSAMDLYTEEEDEEEE